jgi:enterochelin esterase-like enzyme
MDPEAPLTSPRLETLRLAVEAGNTTAIDAFWQELSQQGAPLIEPIAGDDRHSLVTFVWRAEHEHESVAVVNALPGRDSTEPMTRLSGTDLWWKTYRVPNDTRESYQFSIAGRNVTDPLNSRIHVFPDDPEIGFRGWVSSVFALPAAPPQPWSAPRPGAPKGQVTPHRVRSDILDDDYRVWVYTPPDYGADGAPRGFLLVLDGWFYVNLIPTPTILDNLRADGRLPPLVAIMVGSVFAKTRQRDLACYLPFVDFLTRELLPWARQNYRLTEDPAQTTIVGASLGGLMAAFVGLHHSDVFGNVLAQSAFFGWKPRGEEEDEWIARQYIARPRLPLRFYMEAGLLETQIRTIEPGWNNFLIGARYMRDVLRAKGYEVHYSEFSGGHNPMNWQGTLANGLLALLAGRAAGGDGQRA